MVLPDTFADVAFNAPVVVAPSTVTPAFNVPVVVLPVTAKSLFTVSSAPATADPPPTTAEFVASVPELNAPVTVAEASVVAPAFNVPLIIVLPVAPSTVKRSTGVGFVASLMVKSPALLIVTLPLVFTSVVLTPPLNVDAPVTPSVPPTVALLVTAAEFNVARPLVPNVLSDVLPVTPSVPATAVLPVEPSIVNTSAAGVAEFFIVKSPSLVMFTLLGVVMPPDKVERPVTPSVEEIDVAPAFNVPVVVLARVAFPPL